MNTEAYQVLECPVCHGDLSLSKDGKTAKCSSCRKMVALTHFSKEVDGWFRLGEEAQHQGEYDKAIECYDEVLAVQPDEAEVHWRKFLCLYGVEYVQEQTSGVFLPTISRTRAENLLENSDYIAACENAVDSEVYNFYRQEARQINKILTTYQYLNAREEEYDVFISVKQGDDDGHMTEDARVGLTLYHKLSNMGLKVFNSAESLKNMTGTEYEPYIMHALRTSKLLVVVASSEEYLNSRWIKNEWRRFQLLRNSEGALTSRRLVVYSIKLGGGLKVPFEMGAIQLLDVHSDAEPVAQLCRIATTVCPPKAKMSAKVERMFMELEDGEFEEAERLSESVLNDEPRNGYAYLGKLMIELKVCTREELAEQTTSFEDSFNYRKIMRFGDAALIQQMQDCLTAIAERAENNRKKDIYERARALKAKRQWTQAIELFGTIADYGDSQAQTEQCRNGILEDRYQEALSLKTSKQWKAAIKVFEELGDYKGSRAQILECEEGIREDEYERACTLHRNKDYDGAMRAFFALGDYRDSRLQVEICRADSAEAKAEAKAEARAQAQLEAWKAQNTENWAMMLMMLKVLVPPEKYDIIMEMLKYQIGADSIVKACEDMPNRIRRLGEEHLRTAACCIQQSNVSLAFYYWKKALECGLSFEEIRIKIVQAYLSTVEEHTHKRELLSMLIDCRGLNHLGIRSEPMEASVRYIAPIAAGSSHTVGLKADGTVLAVGNNGSGQCNVGGWSDVAAIAAGNYHTVGLKADGTVLAVGNNGSGQCNVSGWSDVVAIAAGYYHTVGLKADGTVLAVGDTNYGRCNVGSWSDVVAIAAGDYHTVGLKADGTVLAVGKNDYGRCDVGSWNLLK